MLAMHVMLSMLFAWHSVDVGPEIKNEKVGYEMHGSAHAR